MGANHFADASEALQIQGRIATPYRAVAGTPQTGLRGPRINAKPAISGGLSAVRNRTELILTRPNRRSTLVAGVERVMGSASALLGRAVLILEDEPLIAMDIAAQVSASGAHSVVTNTVQQALSALVRIKFAAAVIDYRLGDGTAWVVIQRLKDSQIPFVIYSGDEGASASGPVVSKPAIEGHLVQAISELLG